MSDMRRSTKRYEAWLQKQLHGELVEKDLKKKHEKMGQDPFVFLRATYWRWAETILDVCPELKQAPRVLAVGDIHLENFGTWRDVDGRLVWGVNDPDEAAEMPYVIDLVRLATSAALADRAVAVDGVCACIRSGYINALKQPRPFVLDRDHGWLRKRVVVSDDKRASFWQKITSDTNKAKKRCPRRYADALLAAMPEGASGMTVVPRTAGTGSLGRPRWVASGDWRGGLVVREAKALAPSAWAVFRKHGHRKLRSAEISQGRYRAPDPWYRVSGSIVVRRLSPNSRKLEVEDKNDRRVLLDEQMLTAMGFELGNVHLGSGARDEIDRDLRKRISARLAESVRSAAAATVADYNEWRAG
jgi:uncharacterized protein (DUF2252 family)